MAKKVAYTKRWSKDGETRVFINFEGSAVATLYVSGNKYHPKGTWELNGCTSEDVEAARNDKRFFDTAAKKWNTYFPLDESKRYRPSRGDLEDTRRELDENKKESRWVRDWRIIASSQAADS